MLYRNIQTWPSGTERAGSPAQITAEYLSEHEPLELLIFQPLKLCDNSHHHAGGDKDMSASTLSGIKSQKGQAGRIRLTKPCKRIGQKSDKAKCKSLKRELLNCGGKVLQNLDTQFDPGPRLQIPCAEALRECSVFEVKVCGPFWGPTITADAGSDR